HAVGLCVGTSGAAEAQLTVKLGVSRSNFGSGTTVAVTGHGFSANTTIHVWYDQSLTGLFPGNASASPTSDSQGAFSTSLLVKGNPRSYFIHADPSTTAASSVQVNIDACWFQECVVDGDSTDCILGNAPKALEFAGIDFSNCKKVDSNY